MNDEFNTANSGKKTNTFLGDYHVVDKMRVSPRAMRSTSDMMASPYEQVSSVMKPDQENDYKQNEGYETTAA